MNQLEQEMKEKFGTRVLARQPLASYTSFRIGGPADLFVQVENIDELSAALSAADRHGVPAFCLGAGTNLLVSDRGIRGVVLHLGVGFEAIEVEDLHVFSGAAAQFGDLVEKVVAMGLGGLEFGEGIPGTVGGGLVMNAGAFGGEIARVVRLVHGAERDGKQRTLTNEEVGFAYRRTKLPPGFIITGVEFELQQGDHDTLVSRVAELRAKRSARQPRGVPNAGSIFKNPPGTFAGKLLESCGLKGQRMGQAAFSDQHANFIVNLGEAQAADVKALIELARYRVKESTGVLLEPEVKLVGDW